MSEADWGGEGTCCLFSQGSCCGARVSVPAAWRGRASQAPQLLSRGAVRVQQRLAGKGWRVGEAGREGALTVSELGLCL